MKYEENRIQMRSLGAPQPGTVRGRVSRTIAQCQAEVRDPRNGLSGRDTLWPTSKRQSYTCFCSAYAVHAQRCKTTTFESTSKKQTQSKKKKKKLSAPSDSPTANLLTPHHFTYAQCASQPAPARVPRWGRRSPGSGGDDRQ